MSVSMTPTSRFLVLTLAVPALAMGLTEYVIHADSVITEVTLKALKTVRGRKTDSDEIAMASRKERRQLHSEIAGMFDK